MADWVKFVLVDLKDGRKTLVWAVLPMDGAVCLGRVAWYSPWRRYCYFTHKDTVYEQDCLRAIAHWCEQKTAQYKNQRVVGVVRQP